MEGMMECEASSAVDDLKRMRMRMIGGEWPSLQGPVPKRE